MLPTIVLPQLSLDGDVVILIVSFVLLLLCGIAIGREWERDVQQRAREAQKHQMLTRAQLTRDVERVAAAAWRDYDDTNDGEDSETWV